MIMCSREGEKMNEKQNNFLQACKNSHTTVVTFIKLFVLWSELSSKERGEIIYQNVNYLDRTSEEGD